MTARAPTRHALLPGGPAPATQPAVPTEVGQDAKLLELGRKLIAKRREVAAMENGAGSDSEYEEACNALSKIEIEITTTPATTIAGLRAKALAILLDPDLRECNEQRGELDALDFEALLWNLAKDVLRVTQPQPNMT